MKGILLAAGLLLLLCGCGDTNVQPTTPPPTGELVVESTPVESAPISPVFTDWSRLEKTDTLGSLYTRRYEEFTDHLIPAKDYGPLLPYAGKAVYAWWYGNAAQHKFGLVTREGEIVVDPVYQRVEQPAWVDAETGQTRKLPLLLLMENIMEEGGTDCDTYYTLAAEDGSWVTEPYFYCRVLDGQTILLADEEGHVWFCDLQGSITPSPLEQTLSELVSPWWYYEVDIQPDGLAWGAVYDEERVRTGQSRLFNVRTGAIIPLPDVQYCHGWYTDDRWAVATDGIGHGYLDRQGNWALLPQYEGAWEFHNDRAIVTLEGGTHALIDREGSVLLTGWGTELTRSVGSDGVVTYVDYLYHQEERADRFEILAVYDENLNLLPQPASGSRVTTVVPFLTQWEKGMTTIYDGAQVYVMPGEYQVNWVDEENISVSDYENDLHGLYSHRKQQWTVPYGQYQYYIYQTEPSPEGEIRYIAYDREENTDVILDREGNVVTRTADKPVVRHGLTYVQRDTMSGYQDPAGNWVFRYPIQSNSD